MFTYLGLQENWYMLHFQHSYNPNNSLSIIFNVTLQIRVFKHIIMFLRLFNLCWVVNIFCKTVK